MGWITDVSVVYVQSKTYQSSLEARAREISEVKAKASKVTGRLFFFLAAFSSLLHVDQGITPT